MGCGGIRHCNAVTPVACHIEGGTTSHGMCKEPRAQSPDAAHRCPARMTRYPAGDTSMSPSSPETLDLFQILITDRPAPLPPLLAHNHEALRNLYPRARHHLLDLEAGRGFIAAHFPADVLAAYEDVAAYAMKADILRLCLLLVHGGLYVDLGLLMLRPLVLPPGKAISAFREVGPRANPPWTLASSLIRAEPDRPELRRALEISVAHVAARYYGEQAIAVTGPVPLGRAFAEVNRPAEVYAGDVRAATPEFHHHNPLWITEDGLLVALRNKGRETGLGHLGLAGGNDYHAMWQEGRLYGETLPWRIPAITLPRDARLTRARGMMVAIPPGPGGCQIFGPYRPVPAGRYRARFLLEGPAQGMAVMDAVAEEGRLHLAEVRIGEGCEPMLELSLPHAVSDLEIRLRGDAGYAAVVRALEFMPIPQIETFIPESTAGA